MRQNGLHKANPSTPAAGRREPARRQSRLRPAPQPAGGSNAYWMGVVSCSQRSAANDEEKPRLEPSEVEYLWQVDCGESLQRRRLRP